MVVCAWNLSVGEMDTGGSLGAPGQRETLSQRKTKDELFGGPETKKENQRAQASLGLAIHPLNQHLFIKALLCAHFRIWRSE